jgi:hypothetical protein
MHTYLIVEGCLLAAALLTAFAVSVVTGAWRRSR